MPAADIEQIEVLTGIDATTYYGTGATKGVIRITTKVAGS
jgi:TonB-dependent SusC/RagA subfamily outer membrane receptor